MSKLSAVRTSEVTGAFNSITKNIMSIEGLVDAKSKLDRDRIIVDDNAKEVKIHENGLMQIDHDEHKNYNFSSNNNNNNNNNNYNNDNKNDGYVDADDDDDEKDLTNLNWLTELRHQNLHWPNDAIMYDESHTVTDLKDEVNSLRLCKSLVLASTYNTGSQLTRARKELKNASLQTKSPTYTDLSLPTNSRQAIIISNAHLHPTTNANLKSKSKFHKHNLQYLNNKDRMTEFTQNSIASSSKGNRANYDIINNNSNKNSDTDKLLQQKQLKRPTPAERYEIFISKIKRDVTEYERSTFIYQTDTTAKPPFNYSHVIGMAMMEHGRVTLQQICSWIESKFAYFRVRKKWNNSIRHNLSLHHCFRKIDRNKYEKGKGGYWELGLDPKKCDRKRIRNRKNTNMIIKNKIQKQQQPSNEQSQHCLQSRKRKLTTNCLNNVKQLLLVECKNKGGKVSVENDAEELYLDELDVQQNIDVSSFNQQLQHRELCQKQHEQNNLYVTEIIQGDANAMSSKNQQQHQYQLGTIIISTTTTTDTPGVFPTSVQTFSDKPTFNCLISEHIYNLQQQQNMAYENCLSDGVIGNIPTIYENVIISSYLNNGTTHNDGDIEKAAAAVLTQRPNVIVEQLIQPETLNVGGSQLINTFSNTNAYTASVNAHDHDGSPLTLINNYDYTDNNNFRPYIDGIEEAFQYLRSMDNNRGEDLLDNLYDISVSEY